MKTLIPLLFLSLTLWAKPILQESLFVFDEERTHLELFQSIPEMTIDLVSEKGYELYGPYGTSIWLDDLKVDYVSMKTRYGYYDEYPTILDNERKLQELAERFPNILKLTSIGQSVEGRELWVMKLSDNVDIDETEPEFKYIANMHGDEITGREMMMMLIEKLATSYEEGDERITQLIDNTEIYIMPTLNPDGSHHQRRSNSNYADLNRDFPDFIYDPENSHAGREKETIAMMDFQASRKFALSANLHDGAVVVNYPWDTTLERFPFDSLVTDLSKEYASSVPSMYNSYSFEGGITNGADWYIIHGGMQDWSYYWHNDMQITLEISNTKWPSYSKTVSFFDEHLPSLMTYMERTHQGAGFKFTEQAITGTVKIYQYKSYLGEYAFEDSEFYKVLEAGEYRFKVTTEEGIVNEFTVIVDSTIKPNGNYIYLQNFYNLRFAPMNMLLPACMIKMSWEFSYEKNNTYINSISFYTRCNC